MKKILSTYGLSAFFIAFAVWIFNVTKQYPKYYSGAPGSGFWPRILAGMLIALSIALLVENLLSKRKKESEDTNDTIVYRNSKRAYYMFGIILLTAFSIKYLGFIITSLWFICAVMLIMDERRPFVIAISSIAITISVYLIFTYILEMMLPKAFFM